MRIVCNNITGFSCKGDIVVMENSSPFYVFRNKTGRKIDFNLPEGVFFTESDIQRRKKPVDYKLPVLPPREVNIPLPGKLRVIYGQNDNKCSIFLKTGIILMDYALLCLPRFILSYVLAHELGHYRYRGTANSERYCDLYAERELLLRGYNPSQLLMANRFTLNNDDRKKFSYERTKKY